MAMEQAFVEELAATKLQALVRGRQSRLLTEAWRIGENAAAEKIQSCFRSHFRHSSRSSDVGVRSVAARTIQRVFRAYRHRQRSAHESTISEELSDVQHIAATSLQRFWRQTAARYRRELVLEEIEAATCIQALGRGHLARKSCQSLRDSSSQLGLSKPVRSSAQKMTNDDERCRWARPQSCADACVSCTGVGVLNRSRDGGWHP